MTEEGLPLELAHALAADAELGAAFARLAPGRRRDLVASVAGARREETRARRLERALAELRRPRARRPGPDDARLQVRIEGTDLPGRGCGAGDGFPGYRNIHVGLQRRERPGELLDIQPGDAPVARWTLECTAMRTPVGVDLGGPYIQGTPGVRFIYLSWGEVEGGGFVMFRRAKLMLDAVPPATLDDAARSGALLGRLGLTDARGHPVCGRAVPPRVDWSAASG